MCWSVVTPARADPVALEQPEIKRLAGTFLHVTRLDFKGLLPGYKFHLGAGTEIETLAHRETNGDRAFYCYPNS